MNRCAAPNVSEIAVGKRRELRSQHDLAVTAQRQTLGRAFLEFVVIRLPPEMGLFGGGWRGTIAKMTAKMKRR